MNACNAPTRRYRRPNLAPLLALGLLLSACAQPPAAPEFPANSTGAPPGGMCNAQGLASFVGQMATASVTEAVRVRAGARMARILRPGQMITKEFIAERVNLEVDAAGRIVALRCG
ncbi:MAG: I78 family peptidase inhibitor [Burkholderiaceae bacterium]